MGEMLKQFYFVFKVHDLIVIDLFLQSKLASMSNDFKSVLEVRTEVRLLIYV